MARYEKGASASYTRSTLSAHFESGLDGLNEQSPCLRNKTTVALSLKDVLLFTEVSLYLLADHNSRSS